MRHRFTITLLSIFALATAFAAKAPRYIFYFIGDGMGLSQALGAETYLRTVHPGDEPLLMMQFPVASQCTTYSASSPVTDSAAAGTALATGSKTKNGMLGMNADSVAVKSIAAELFDRGYGVALLTNVQPDDATPGAFYAHVPSRSMFYDIGCQAARSGYDFIAGTALRGMTDKKGRPTGLENEFEKNGVKIVYGLDALRASDAKRVMLLDVPDSDNPHYIYTIDSIASVMTLPDMTKAALEHLKKNGRDRFFMMVEGGNIDHACHSNDGGTVIKDILSFNQALRHAYDFYLAHPDETLIIVTADHETGGMALGNNSVGYDLHLQYIDCQRISKDRFAEYCRKLRSTDPAPQWADMHRFLEENLGFWNCLPVSDKQTAALESEFQRCFTGDIPADRQTLYNSFNSFTDMVYGVIDSVTGLAFTSNCHTAGPVPVFAIGVGAERFSPMNDNTRLPAIIRSLTE